MKQFTEATNLDLTDPTNYPNGQLKDATTTTAKDGTRINKTLLADIRTVFTRALKLTGTDPNGEYDTDNSSQLFDALKIAIPGDSGWVEVTDLGAGNTNGSDSTYGKLRCRRLHGIVYVTGSYTQGATTNGFILPEGFRPPAGVYPTPVVYSGIDAFTILDNGLFFNQNGIKQENFYFNCFFPIDPTV